MSEDANTGVAGTVRRWARPLLAGSLTVVVGCLASLVVLWFLERDDGEGDRAGERERVMSTATQFVLGVNTFGPDDLDDQGQLTGYVDRTSGLMTSKFSEDFEQAQELPEQLVTQGKIGRSATVNAVAVSSIGEDSATAIAAFELTHSFPSAKNPKQRIEDQPVPTRWRLTLRRIEGEWLVDNYEVLPERLQDENSPGAGGPAPSVPSVPQSPTGAESPTGAGGDDR